MTNQKQKVTGSLTEARATITILVTGKRRAGIASGDSNDVDRNFCRRIQIGLDG